MKFKELVLEAAHSYMIYMTLVPNARLLKWADTLLQVGSIIDIDASESYGSESDKVRRAQEIYALNRDLRAMAYEPIYAMANAIRLKMNHPDMPKDAEYLKARHNIESACSRAEERKLDPEYDIIILKNSLIMSMNEAFGMLNKLQDHKYPEIKTRKEMIEVPDDRLR